MTRQQKRKQQRELVSNWERISLNKGLVPKKGMEEQLKRYQLGMVDRDEHFNQELYYQFRIDDLDFSYTVKYDGNKGFEHSEYIKPGVDINDLREQIGPRTVTQMLVSFFKKVQKNTHTWVDEKNLDICLTLFLEQTIINNIKTISSFSSGFEFRPPVGILDWKKSLPTIFHNQFVSDFLIPFFKNEGGGYVCSLNEKFLNQYSTIINVQSNNN